MCLVQFNYCGRRFWKLFTFSAIVLIKLSCVVVARYSILVYVG